MTTNTAPSHAGNYVVGVQELSAYIRRNGGLDCSKDSRELRSEFEDIFLCRVPLSAILSAAAFTGHAIIPTQMGQRFDSALSTDCSIQMPTSQGPLIAALFISKPLIERQP